MSKEVSRQDLGSELMVYDKEKDNVHVLNETAKVILQLAEKGHSLNDIEKELKKRFSINSNQDVKGDIKRVIKELQEKGLLVSS